VAANAEEIRAVASELVDRVATVLGHVGDVGDQLRRAVQSYNAAVGSLETRLLPQARRVRELGAEGRKAIPDGMAPVDVPVRRLPAPDLPGA
jgi:DNA recombination protein RmuC